MRVDFALLQKRTIYTLRWLWFFANRALSRLGGWKSRNSHPHYWQEAKKNERHAVWECEFWFFEHLLYGKRNFHRPKIQKWSKNVFPRVGLKALTRFRFEHFKNPILSWSWLWRIARRKTHQKNRGPEVNFLDAVLTFSRRAWKFAFSLRRCCQTQECATPPLREAEKIMSATMRGSVKSDFCNTLSTRSKVFLYFVVWLAFGASEFHGFVGGELRSVFPTWVWRAWILSASHTSEIAFSQRRCWKNENLKRHYWREYDCRLHSSSRRMQKAIVAHTPSTRRRNSWDVDCRRWPPHRYYYIYD